MVELRELRYFVAVAEELHFGRAARRLRISQPPLSQAIAKLETTLGVVLLRRSSRRVELTAAGVAFLEAARRTLAEVESAILTARRIANGEIGRLRVLASPITRLSILPAVAAELARRAPGVEVEAAELTQQSVLAELEAGNANLAFLVEPVVPAGFGHEMLRRDNAVVLVGKLNPLARQGRVTLRQAVRQPFVIWPRESAQGFYDAALGAVRARGLDPELVHHPAAGADWEGQFVRSGFALVPEVVRGFAGVSCVPLVEDVVFETKMIWHPDDPAPGLATLLDAARACARDREWLTAARRPAA